MRVRVVVTVVALAAVSGCGSGGDPPVSRGAYVAAMNRICREGARESAPVQRKLDSIPTSAPDSARRAAPWLRRQYELSIKQIGEFGRPRPPADLEPKVRAWLASSKETAAVLRKQVAAAERGDKRRAIQLEKAIVIPAARRDRLLRALPFCKPAQRG
jgi:hypothetical protein